MNAKFRGCPGECHAAIPTVTEARCSLPRLLVLQKKVHVRLDVLTDKASSFVVHLLSFVVKVLNPLFYHIPSEHT